MKLLKNKSTIIILILVAVIFVFKERPYPLNAAHPYPHGNTLRLPLNFTGSYREADEKIGLMIAERIRYLQQQGVGFEDIKAKIKDEFRKPRFNLKERIRTGNNHNYYLRAGEKYFEIINGSFASINEATFNNGKRLMIKIAKDSYAKERLKKEIIAAVSKLNRKLKNRPPNMKEVARIMPSLKGSLNPEAFLYAYFKRNDMNPEDYGIGRFSGNANIIVKSDFAFAGIRVRLPVQLYKKVMIVTEKTPISKETKIDIADIKNPENRLTLEYDKESGILKLSYAQPSTKEVVSQIAGVKEGDCLTNLSANPVFCDFYDTVFSIPLYPGEGRLKAVAEHVGEKKFGIHSYQTEKRTFFHGVLYLPSFYDTHSRRITFYRDRAREARFIVIVDIADPDNIVGYEWREGGIISLETGKKLEHDFIDGKGMFSYYLSNQPDFKRFDDALDKRILIKTINPSNNITLVGLGDGKFAFRVKETVTIISFEGCRARITTRADRERYPVRIRRISDEREIKIGYNDPRVQGEFIIEGLNWEDGTPVVMKGFKGRRGKTGYFNISTILEMLNRNLLQGIEASDILFEVLGYHHYNPIPNLREAVRSYDVREIEGRRFLVEGELVDPEIFEAVEKGGLFLNPLHLSPLVEINGGADSSYALENGNFITDDGGFFRLWNSDTGELIYDLSKEKGVRIKDYGIREPQNNNFITMHLDGTWKLRSGLTGKMISELSIGEGQKVGDAESFRLSNGNFITHDSDGNFRMWDGNTGSLIDISTSLQWQNLSYDFTYELPNGNIVKGITHGIESGIGVIRDGRSGKIIATLLINGLNVVFRGMGVLPKQNRIFTKASSGDCIIWDGNTGKVINVLSGRGGVTKRAPDRRDPNKPLPMSPRDIAEKLIMSHEGLSDFLQPTHNNLVAQYDICERPNGDIVTADGDGLCRIWKKGKAIYALSVPGISTGYCALSALPNGNILTKDKDVVWTLWNGDTGEFINTLSVKEMGIIGSNAYYVLSNGNIITSDVAVYGADSDGVRMFDGNTGKFIADISEHELKGAVQWWLYELPGGNFVIRDGDGLCKIRDSNRGEIIKLLSVTGVMVGYNGVHVFSDGKILTNDSDGISRIWLFKNATAVPAHLEKASNISI